MFYAKLMLGVAAFVVAIYLLDWREILHAAEQLSLAGTLVVLLLILVEFPLLPWRWRLIVGQAGGIPARRQVEMYLIAIFLGLFTPAQLGSDAYRLVQLRRGGVRTWLVLTMLLRERMLGLSGQLLFISAAAMVALSIETGHSAARTRFPVVVRRAVCHRYRGAF